jgi:hypothetical protein
VSAELGRPPSVFLANVARLQRRLLKNFFVCFDCGTLILELLGPAPYLLNENAVSDFRSQSTVLTL